MVTEQCQANELAALRHFLGAQRRAALAVVQGLNDANARTTVVPSGWTPISMIQHLTGVER